jgi:hypothetical protein
MPALSPDQLDDLQAFLKDWLRHTGRTQADLRRALRAASIRMPVLVDELHRTYALEGEDQASERGEDSLSSPSIDASLGQLDLLLEEIRQQELP